MNKYTIDEKKKNRELWCQALESGEFKQGQGRLQSRDGHCCLGVLTEVFCHETGTVTERDAAGHLVGTELVSYLACSEDYQGVQKWVGLTDAYGTYKTLVEEAALTDDNDTKKLSFTEIAEIIRSEPEGLFDE